MRIINMKYTLGLLVILNLTQSSLQNDVKLKECTLKCEKTSFDPVCGSDNQTYANLCFMSCLSNAKFISNGKCKSSNSLKCSCENEVEYVCGINKVTYMNPCSAQCMGIEIASMGKCPVDCENKVCPEVFKPVCATDGLTYKNHCVLHCEHKKEMNSYSRCPAKINCSAVVEYEPVCGQDGVTYNNFQAADCASMAIASVGKCFHDCSQACTEEYIPVCGTDNLTYLNICDLHCRKNLKLKSIRACPPKQRCHCSSKDEPVCGVDGITYANQCLADCQSMSIKAFSSCDKLSEDGLAEM